MTIYTRPLYAVSPAYLALGCVGFLTSAPIFAQSDVPTNTPRLGGVKVEASAIEDEVKVDRVQSPKATAPLLDTPQTVTVISNQTIRKQNLLTLREALQTIPGITFGAGEGGGGFGDSINLRGYSANSDITQDGVRDSAQYSRNDPFNTQQIEVYNGANSVYNGSGSVGGTINLVSKTPQADDLTVLNAAVGTDSYYRVTADTNRRLSDMIAVRLNAMYHHNDVPGRDVEKLKRWGFAPAITIGIDSPTRLTFDYFHQEDDNTPQYGVPYFYLGGGVPAGVDREAYYGYRNVDRQRINVDRFTTTFEHDFDTVSIRNVSRWQDVQQTTIASQPQGTFCLGTTGLTPTGGICRTSPAAATVVAVPGVGDVTTVPATVETTVPAGYFLPSGRGVYRDTRNQLIYDQLDVHSEFDTAGIKHTLVIGASALWEKFNLANGSVLRATDGTNPYNGGTILQHQPFINIANPGQVIVPAGGNAAEFGSNLYGGPFYMVQTGAAEGEQTSYAIYAFDTIKLSDMFELNAGLRYEKVDGDSRADVVAVSATDGARFYVPGTTFKNKDNLFSYRVGLVFKPVANGSIYVAYANSKTPSKVNVNGTCTIATCNVKPENGTSYEIGVKWEVGDGVQLTAAAFRNDRDQFKVASNDPLQPDNTLDGKSRVNGIALGASGQITSGWQIFANYTYLDSKVRQSVSDFCLANPSTACGNTAAIRDPLAGNALTNTPKHSGSLFTTYLLPFGLQIGYGFTYQGSYLISNNALPANLVSGTDFPKSKSWLTHRAFFSYEVSEGITAQLNIQNFTNEKYYTRLRNSANGWATPGDGRSATISIFYSF
jgi:catecholate siderophore receptor